MRDYVIQECVTCWYVLARVYERQGFSMASVIGGVWTSNCDCVRLTDGRQILRSYGTVVAGFFPKEEHPWKRTKQYFSVTTSRHINKWLGERRDVGAASKAVAIDHKELLELAKPIESVQ